MNIDFVKLSKTFRDNSLNYYWFTFEFLQNESGVLVRRFTRDWEIQGHVSFYTYDELNALLVHPVTDLMEKILK